MFKLEVGLEKEGLNILYKLNEPNFDHFLAEILLGLKESKSFAYKIMGDLYKTGVFVEADPDIAEKFYSKAIDLGDLSSVENYIDIITTKYLNKEIPNEKKNKIMELIKTGENNGAGNIFFIKAELISKGEVFPFDYDNIILNLSKALDLGVGFAGFRLYGIQKKRFYNLKRVGNIDFKLKSAAIKSLKMGAKLGCNYCINEINKLNNNQILFDVNFKNRSYVDSYYSNNLDISGKEKFLNKIFSNIADKYNLKKSELFLESVSFSEFENFHKDRDNKLFLKFSNFKYEDEFRALVTKDNYFNEDYTLMYYDLFEKKDFESINNIAIFYVFGCGVNKNIDKALIFFEQAAENGVDVANYNIALLNNVVESKKRNDKYYNFSTYCQKAINSGVVGSKALLALNKIMCHEAMDARNPPVGASYCSTGTIIGLFKESYDQGDLLANYHLGEYLLYKVRSVKSVENLIDLFLKSAKVNANSYYYIARIHTGFFEYLKHPFKPQDYDDIVNPEKGIYFLKIAADHGVVEAEIWYGLFLLGNEYLEKYDRLFSFKFKSIERNLDPQLGIKYLISATEKKSASACKCLCMVYSEHPDFKNNELSFYWGMLSRKYGLSLTPYVNIFQYFEELIDCKGIIEFIN